MRIKEKMKTLVILAILFIFSCYSSHSFAKLESSFPEFECTVTEKKNVSQVSELLGTNNYPSVSLRKKSSGDWLLNIKNKKIVLTSKEIAKNNKVILNQVTYEINYQNNLLKIDLLGKAPSRNGQLWELKKPPLQPVFLALLTCH